MATTAFSRFAAPTNSNDPVFVIVIVEDSRLMASKWEDIRNHYLLTLLESLREADLTVPMRVWWLTSSPAFSALSTTVHDVSQCASIPDLNLGQQSDIAISTSTIRRATNIFSSSSRQKSGHQHLIVVAALPLLGGGDGPSPMQSGIDPWIGISLALCQEKLRLHLILGPAHEAKAFHELFHRARYCQSLAEVPPWFHVDTSRFTVLLSGTLCDGSQASSPEILGNPLCPSTPTTPNSMSLPPSPTHQSRPTSSRRSSLSSTIAPRIDAHDSAALRSSNDTLGLVSYLQRMHGLTKKRSYGVKAAKRQPPADLRLSSARPILPRLDLPASPYASETSPTYDGSSTIASDSMHDVSSSRSSMSPTDRRARSRGPWLPTTPGHANGSASSPPDSTTAALLSLQAMTPRLTEFHTMEWSARGSTADRKHGTRAAARGAELMQALAYHHATARTPALSHGQQFYDQSSAMLRGATHLPSVPDANYNLEGMSPPSGMSSLPRGSVSYDNTPLGSQTSTPLPSPSLTAPGSPTNSFEDQPFIVTPEYEAFVAARFEEVLRSGAIQASMTPEMSAAVPGQPSYEAASPTAQEHGFSYSLQQPMHQGLNYPEAGYVSHQHDELTLGFQNSGPHWDGGQSYVQQVPEYGALHAGQWYPS